MSTKTIKYLRGVFGFSCAAMVLATANTGHAAPIYLLLEGTVTSNSYYEPSYPPPAQNTHVGNTVRIEAVWDDAKMFTHDVNADPNKATYGSNGMVGGKMEYLYDISCGPGCTSPYWGTVNGNHWTDANGSTSYWDHSSAVPYFTVSTNGSTGWPDYLDYPNDTATSHDGWHVLLQTEKTAQGVSISLNVEGNASWANGSNNKSFSLLLNSADTSVLSSDLLTFIWNSAMGGSASGDHMWSGGRGFLFSSSDDQIQWSRAVLSYNAADVAPVPLPAGLPLLGSGLAALLGLGRYRSGRKQH